MYAQLKNLNLDRLDLEEAVSLSAFGVIVQQRYLALALEAPEWLSVNLKTLDREIESRVSDDLTKQLREKRARLESLKPADQKRRELALEIKRLEKALA